MELVVFVIASLMVLGGALGVVLRQHPVHAALSLVLTLFGVAVHFVAQEAHFLAAVQVIVYAGAIVVLFLFVIMLLGVDRAEAFDRDPILGQRPAAIAAGVAILGLSLTALLSVGSRVTGQASAVAAIDPDEPNINSLARVLFTDYVFAFEVTSVLLTVAVVGAVVLSRRAGAAIDADEFPEGTTADLMAERAEARLAGAGEGAPSDEPDAAADDSAEEVGN
jgi:NADH-quinone oxidoreductase subunit J